MSKLDSWKRGSDSFERSNQVYKVFIMYGEPKNETDITYSKPKIIESFETKEELDRWFAERIETVVCDCMHLQKHGKVLSSLDINYDDHKAKIVYKTNYVVKYFIEERRS